MHGMKGALVAISSINPDIDDLVQYIIEHFSHHFSNNSIHADFSPSLWHRKRAN